MPRCGVLLTLHHAGVGQWLQLGGHCGPMTTIADAAAREGREGVRYRGLDLSVGIVGLHTHSVTCSLGVPTRHLDVRFAALTPRRNRTTDCPRSLRSDESVDLALVADR